MAKRNVEAAFAAVGIIEKYAESLAVFEHVFQQFFKGSLKIYFLVRTHWPRGGLGEVNTSTWLCSGWMRNRKNRNKNLMAWFAIPATLPVLFVLLNDNAYSQFTVYILSGVR
jgi:hypothetical protein